MTAIKNYATGLFLLFILLAILGLSSWVLYIIWDYLGQMVSFSVPIGG